MPQCCAAWGCTNSRTITTRIRGITFHKFPKEKELRRQWEFAVRREHFSASDYSVLCSEHFKQEDIDRTGQIVRIRDGAKPTVFIFQRQVATRTTQASRKAEESLSVDCCLQEPEPLPNVEHLYAMPASPTGLKTKFSKALARVESLERDMRNTKVRERRAKKTLHGLLEDLRGKNLINEELKERLDFYSDLPIGLLSKQGHEYSKDQKEFLTLI
ncbi:THAP domain-containing protein 6-like [Osmerus mordax]|uniref:THAP domain-containing protein 6-like n=1 Tax=Osmerus mordax TaxID=8014 RepID=UPI0035107B59